MYVRIFAWECAVVHDPYVKSCLHLLCVYVEGWGRMPCLRCFGGGDDLHLVMFICYSGSSMPARERERDHVPRESCVWYIFRAIVHRCLLHTCCVNDVCSCPLWGSCCDRSTRVQPAHLSRAEGGQPHGHKSCPVLYLDLSVRVPSQRLESSSSSRCCISCFLW